MRTCCNIFILILSLFFYCSLNVLACFSITDDLNLPNPVLNANFNLLPDVSPFTDCWNAAIRIRSSQNNWRLVANRTGPDPQGVSGDTSQNVMADDITLDFSLNALGMANSDGAILVSPFSSMTNLSSIQSGTFVISGIKKSGNSCSTNNPDFYKLTKTLCLFRDFIFNIGEYNGEVSYILVAP